MKLEKNKLLICCDGGGASGKTTGAKLIAKKYKLNFLSSGNLYRFASYKILKNRPSNEISYLKKIFKKFKVSQIKTNKKEIKDSLNLNILCYSNKYSHHKYKQYLHDFIMRHNIYL